MSPTYVKVDKLISDKSDLQDIINLIENTLKLITDRPLHKVINSIDFTLETNETDRGGKQINITLDVDKQLRSIIFGKKFSNISCMRKLISNASGKRGIFYQLNVKE